MSLIGIIANRREIQAISKEVKEDVEIIEITRQSIKNIRNIKFEEIIFLKNINLDKEEYKYMNEIISNTQYLILNSDIKIEILKKISLNKPIKLITFGFNSKSTITISSVSDEKIIVCIQRDLQNIKGDLIETQEKELIRLARKNIYNHLVVFIIKELHNL